MSTCPKCMATGDAPCVRVDAAVSRYVAQNPYAARLPRKVEEVYATLGEPIAIKHRERLAVEREQKSRRDRHSRLRLDLPPATFMFPGHLTDEQVETFRESWRSRKRGAAAIMDGGVTVTYAPQRPSVKAKRGPTPRWLRAR
jgi:hypothetical protein